MMRSITLLALVIVLASCSLTAPRDVGKANMFALTATDDLRASRTIHATLKVNYPVAPSELDTYRIAVTKKDGRQDYFAGARWSEFLPSALQTALHDGFMRANAFRNVEKDEGSTAGKYMLNTEIDDCRAIYKDNVKTPVAVMRLSFNLLNPDNHVVSRFSAEGRVMARKNTLPAIAEAFNAAFNEAMKTALQKLRPKK